MKLSQLFLLAICLFTIGCVATVPSVPTSHIPEKAHEVHLSGAYGLPRFSGNLGYNPHKNFGLVMAANAGKESWFSVLGTNLNRSKWRTFLEGGFAGYHHFSEDFSMSLTPTYGKGKFYIIEDPLISSSTDTLGGNEIRKAIFLNAQYRLKISEDSNLKFRFGVKTAMNQMSINQSDVKTEIGKSYNLTTVEPMLYVAIEFYNFSYFITTGGDVAGSKYKNENLELSRSPLYFGTGFAYTFNGEKPWAEKTKKKKTK